MLISSIEVLPGCGRGAPAPLADDVLPDLTAEVEGGSEAFAACLRRIGDVGEVTDAVSRGVAAGAEVSWDARTLGNGLAGIALALLLLPRSHTGVPPVAHDVLVAATAATASVPLTARGLYDGAAGFDRVLAIFAAHDGRYDAASARFRDRVLASMLNEVVEPSRAHSVDLDLISGRAGWVLQLSDAAASSHARAHDIARTVSRDLADRVREATIPALRERMDGPSDPADRPPTPSAGGLGHGLAGVLLALSASLITGVDDVIVREQTESLADALADAVDPTAALAATSAGPDARPAWCRGELGTAVALLRAGEALGDHGLRDRAATAIVERIGAFTDDPETTADGSLCHGIAGLAAVHAAARPYAEGRRWATVDRAVWRRLRESFDPTASFGFRTASHDDPAFLMGAAGALVMLGGDAHARTICTRLLTGDVGDV